MDRFAWLDARKWWISPWKGFSQCSTCNEHRFFFCNKIKWLFQGFTSFHVDAREVSNSHQGIRCSPEAAHLLFIAHSTLSDPAQLVWTLPFSSFFLREYLFCLIQLFINLEFHTEVHYEVMAFGLLGITLRSSRGKALGDAGFLCL